MAVIEKGVASPSTKHQNSLDISAISVANGVGVRVRELLVVWQFTVNNNHCVNEIIWSALYSVKMLCKDTILQHVKICCNLIRYVRRDTFIRL